MKYLPLFIVFLYCSPGGSEDYEGKKGVDYLDTSDIPFDSYRLITIKKCEYIFWKGPGTYSHKGKIDFEHHAGCTNPIHKCGDTE